VHTAWFSDNLSTSQLAGKMEKPRFNLTASLLQSEQFAAVPANGANDETMSVTDKRQRTVVEYRPLKDRYACDNVKAQD